MNAYSSTRRLRRAIGAAAIALVPLAGCGEVDRSLAVVDPDIINPEDTQSPAAASALRLGALARHNQASSGGESFWLLGGLLADEWRSSDTFVQRDQTDQRTPQRDNANISDAFRAVQRARVAGQVAARALTTAGAAKWQIAEMYVIQAYQENQLAENMCSGVPFSGIDAEGRDFYGAPLPTTEVLTIALAHADSALALNGGTATDSTRVANAAKIVKGRILLNLNRPADAAAAVAGIPTSFEVVNDHSQTSRTNQIWSLNGSAGRWTVSNGEGINGLDFVVTGDARLPTCKGTTTTHAPTASFTEVPTCPAGYSANPFDVGTTPVPFVVQLKWPTRESSAAWANGVEARLIEAEAQLRASNPAGALTTLNALRTTVSGLAPLTLQPTTAGQVDQLFRERAFWLFSTGHRLGDLRRLVRQYNRPVNQVYPTGEWYLGAQYGDAVNFEIPQTEENNPTQGAGQCIDKNA